MTNFALPAKRKRRLTGMAVALILLIIPLSYIMTLAQSPVLGDPTEYTFVAHMLGIAHPPGYAFMTLLGKLFQTIIPVGNIAWRMHLLAAVSATIACLFVFGTVLTAVKNLPGFKSHGSLGVIAALFAALSVGTAVNHWQHAIHANPHIITGTFLVANLFFLTKWWAGGNGVMRNSGDEVNPPSSPHHRKSSSDKWLLIFCFSAGLGITHHPLTVFGFLGYGLFVLVVRPSIWRDWRTDFAQDGGFGPAGFECVAPLPYSQPDGSRFWPHHHEYPQRIFGPHPGPRPVGKSAFL